MKKNDPDDKLFFTTAGFGVKKLSKTKILKHWEKIIYLLKQGEAMINENSKDYAFGYLKGELNQTIVCLNLLSGINQNRYTVDGAWDRLKDKRDYLEKKLDEIEQEEQKGGKE